MAEEGKGETSTTSILFLAGAIGIGIWFLTVASDFVASGTSPVYAIFFIVPICGVLLVVVVLAEVVKSLSGSSKNNIRGENYKNCPICGTANHLDRKNCGSCKNRLP